MLGLGDIGPLAAKPVMEGKGVLFKKFAGVDVFDIELAERDPDFSGRNNPHRQPRSGCPMGMGIMLALRHD